MRINSEEMQINSEEMQINSEEIFELEAVKSDAREDTAQTKLYYDESPKGENVV